MPAGLRPKATRSSRGGKGGLDQLPPPNATCRYAFRAPLRVGGPRLSDNSILPHLRRSTLSLPESAVEQALLESEGRLLREHSSGRLPDACQRRSTRRPGTASPKIKPRHTKCLQLAEARFVLGVAIESLRLRRLPNRESASMNSPTKWARLIARTGNFLRALITDYSFRPSSGISLSTTARHGAEVVDGAHSIRRPTSTSFAVRPIALPAGKHVLRALCWECLPARSASKARCRCRVAALRRRAARRARHQRTIRAYPSSLLPRVHPLFPARTRDRPMKHNQRGFNPCDPISIDARTRASHASYRRSRSRSRGRGSCCRCPRTIKAAPPSSERSEKVAAVGGSRPARRGDLGTEQ